MKTTIITLMFAFIVSAAFSQTNYTNAGNKSHKITLYEGNYIDSTFKVMDTVYSIKNRLPFKTTSIKFQESGVNKNGNW